MARNSIESPTDIATFARRKWPKITDMQIIENQSKFKFVHWFANHCPRCKGPHQCLDGKGAGRAVGSFSEDGRFIVSIEPCPKTIKNTKKGREKMSDENLKIIQCARVTPAAARLDRMAEPPVTHRINMIQTGSMRHYERIPIPQNPRAERREMAQRHEKARR